MKLRPYQQEALDGLTRALGVHRRVLLQTPTGGGKTVIASKMLAGAMRKGRRAFFIAHRSELISQTAQAMERFDIDFGFCAAGFPRDYARPVTIGSVGTLASRLEKVGAPDLVIFDEAHHVAAASWRKIADAFPRAYQVGLSATPERLDGKPLDHFQALVPGPPTRWLIEQGYLSDFRLFSHPAPAGVDGVRLRGGDYDPVQLAEAMGDPAIVGDAVAHYLDLCPHLPAAVFCVSVERSLQTRDAFRAAGVTAEHLDGATPRGVRRDTLDAFRAGRVRVLTSVDLFGEGLDMPELGAVILLRPTKSLGLALQQVGRALRPSYANGFDVDTLDGRMAAMAAGQKPLAFILDHAGNFGSSGPHGLPDDPRNWSLEGRKKLARAGGGAPARICAHCFGANPPGTSTCQFCGNQMKLSPREVREIEGRLEEVERLRQAEQARAAVARRPVPAADSFEAIVEISAARGHRSPWRFAESVLRQRGEVVTDDQYLAALQAFAEARGYKPGWVWKQMQMRHRMEAAEDEAA